MSKTLVCLVLCQVLNTQHSVWHEEVIEKYLLKNDWIYLLLTICPITGSWDVVVSLSVSSVTQSYLTLCNPMDCSMLGFPVLHQLTELAQTHVHQVGHAIQPSHPLSAPSLPTFNLSQHQGLFKQVSFSHQVAKVLELQLQLQSFQWIFRADFL